MLALSALPVLLFAIGPGWALLPAGHVQFDHIKSVPSQWSRSLRADPSHRFELAIAMDRTSHVETQLYGISIPGSEQYQKHLSREEAQRLLSPDEDTYEEVVAWLTASGVGISDITSENHWLKVKTTVDTANSMLGANFSWFKHQDSGKEVLRTMAFSVPSELRSKISLISPTTRFCSHPAMHQTNGGGAAQRIGGRPATELRRRFFPVNDGAVQPAVPQSKTIWPRAQVDPTCNRTITPDCVRSLYNVPANMTMSKSRGVGVFVALSQVPQFADYAFFGQRVDASALQVSYHPCHFFMHIIYRPTRFPCPCRQTSRSSASPTAQPPRT